MKNLAKKGISLTLVAMMLTMSACTSNGSGAAKQTTAPAAPSTATPAAPSTAAQAPAPAASQATIVLKLGVNEAPSHPGTLGPLKMADLVKEKSNGRISIEVYDSAKLGDHNERLQGLKMGTVEMTTVGPANISSVIPCLTVFDLPFLYKSKEQAFKYFDGDSGKKVADLCEKNGYKLLGVMDMGLRYLTNSKKPIVEPSDLTGMKIRSQQSQLSQDIIKAMGASPVPMAFSELYMAMQQKVVDGQENPLAQIYNSKFYEVQPYLSLSGHQLSLQFVLISLITWNKLSDADKTMIQECATEAIVWERDLMQQQETELLQKLKDVGMKVNDVDQAAFIKAVSSIRAKAEKDNGADAVTILSDLDKIS